MNPRLSSGRIASAVALACLCACSSGVTSGPTPTVIVGAPATVVKNDGTTLQVSATCISPDGTAGSGSVIFSSALGTLDGAAGQTTVALTGGIASATFVCNASTDPACTPGTVIVNARWGAAVSSLHLTLTGPAGGGGGTDAGTDAGTGGIDAGTGGGTGTTPSNILSLGSSPSVLGLKGSGIQENGVTTFLVTDPYGLPVPGATVNFAQKAPQLVALGATSGVSGADGKVKLPYTAGAEVGISAVTATLAVNSAVAEQSIAVRGAKPSANGFYFRCDHASLPVYTTIAEFETMTCTVRLTDRYGNRVGIPTLVRFATEAGAIASSVMTKGFDPAHPDDSAEGTATVTFTSDTGNGNSPADVDPLGPIAQYPFDRGQEPSWTDASSLTLNPRDQLVTIVAMIRGEEAFEDANHNGVLDANEVFVDQGDPFVDANDNGLYDQTGPGSTGIWEMRFCGLNPDCSTYHGPNGVWDPDTVLWKPAWVVFTALASPLTYANSATFTAAYFTPAAQNGCVDYANGPTGNANHGPTMSAKIYAYDYWLNVPPAGWTLSVGNVSTPKVSVAKFQVLNLETWGSMGVLGFDFDWVRVAASGPNAGNACSIANGQACIEKLVFGGFSDGRVGAVSVTGTVTKPTDSTTNFGCDPTSDQYKFGTFTFDVSIAQAHSTTLTSTLTGLFARGQ